MVLKRIVAGGPSRKTRFHDEEGNFIDLAGLLYAPKAWAYGIGRVAFNRRPQTPWLSLRAIKEFDRLIQKDWNVVEFGSGMSTVWLAERCGFLYSVDRDPSWYENVSAMLRERQISNVRHELRGVDTYADLSEFENGFFDFALVDGEIRSACILSVLEKLKPGGLIYLDNSDVIQKSNQDLGLNPKPKEILLRAVETRGGTAKYFTDFVTTNFIVGQGMLARLP